MRSASPSCRRRSVRPARGSRDGPPRPGPRPRPEATTPSRRQAAGPGPRAGTSRGRRRRGGSRRLRGVSCPPGCPARRRSPRRRVRRPRPRAGRPVPWHSRRTCRRGRGRAAPGRPRPEHSRSALRWRAPLFRHRRALRDRRRPCPRSVRRRPLLHTLQRSRTARSAPTENSEGPGLRAFLHRADAAMRVPLHFRGPRAVRQRARVVPFSPLEKRHGQDRSQSCDHARLHRVQAAELPDDEVQAEHAGPGRVPEVLPLVRAHTPHRETR